MHSVHKAGSIYIKNLKLKNIQLVVDSFYPKNGDIKKHFVGHYWHANLQGFANIGKLPVSNTFNKRYAVKNLIGSNFT